MWKYPENNNNSSSSSSSSCSSSSSYNTIINNLNDINCKKLSPYLFVVDFDETLAFYDSYHKLDKSSYVYSRPYLYNFLDYIRQSNKNNIIILWTAGTFEYISKMIFLLNISHYFNYILHRDHCSISKKKTGCRKSYTYLISLFPQYKYFRAILIDDYAIDNTKCDNNNDDYFQIISIKPYTYKDILIHLSSSNSNNIGDNTLLNLILYLDTKYFNYKNRKIKNNNNSNNNNNNNIMNRYIFYVDANNLLNIKIYNTNTISNSTSLFPILYFTIYL